MRKQYTLTMDIEVHDVPSLYVAAKHHAVHKDGLTPAEADELLKPDGKTIDVAACLSMLIDPGSLIGCEINETSVEEFHHG